MITKHYKVVTKDLKSCQQKDNAATVQYVEGSFVRAHKWLEAKEYGLMVFDNLKSVLEFSRWYVHGTKLFECHVRKIYTKLPPYALSICDTEKASTQGDWLQALRYTYLLGQWPVGTVMVKQVKLTRELCPQCGSWEGLKWPKGCEDCGWQI